MTTRPPTRDDDRAPQSPFSGLPESEVRAFYEAAGRLVDARSWSPSMHDGPFHVDIPALGVRDACARLVVHGRAHCSKQ